ncbi:MAG: hypothetical protein R2748_17550 [Bryobacterales bacterium]
MSRWLSGGSAVAWPPMASTMTPPRPKLIDGPKTGSVVTPTINSREPRVHMGSTKTPSTRASGATRWTAAIISS